MSDDEFTGDRTDIKSGPRDECGSRDLVRDGGPDEDEGDVQMIDGLFRSLSVQRRRYVLYELRANDVCNLETLAPTITALTRDVPRSEVASDDVESTKAQLLHVDIPLLEDAGVVEYDPRSETLRCSDPPALLDTFLRLCVDIDTS